MKELWVSDRAFALTFLSIQKIFYNFHDYL